VVKNFINFALTNDELKLLKSEQQTQKQIQKKANKKQHKPDQASYDGRSDPNFYKNYVDQFEYGDINREFVPVPKHKYTIHLHRAVFTEELY
jgi:hypothetical protein